jgi:hypothetical protein
MQYSPTSFQDFQPPVQLYQSQPLPQSPTYALRPAHPSNVFSHIEHPATSSEDPADNLSSDDEDEYQLRATTPHYSEQHTRAPSQSYNHTGSYDSRPREPPSFDPHSHSDRGMSQSNPYALSRAPAPVSQVGTLRPVVARRGRGRNGSDSSAGSMLSNAAVFGDKIYRTDTLHDAMDCESIRLFASVMRMAKRVRFAARSTKPTSAQFQPQSAPATHSHDFPNGGVPEQQEHVFRAYKPAAPEMDPPYIPAPSPRAAGEMELQDSDHPFVYKGADWDYPLRGLNAATASTDADAMSLDSRDQERRSSSRGSSAGAVRHPKRGRKTATSVDSSARDASGDGKRKSVMACHFCRCESCMVFGALCRVADGTAYIL